MPHPEQPSITTTLRPERLLSVLAAEHALLGVVRVLDTRGIAVMPLKGVLLRKLIYRDPRRRLADDVDVLVPEDRYADARAALARAGLRFQFESPGRQETTWRTRADVDIDLHARLFAPGRFRMPTHELFARGRRDASLFGLPVVLPSTVDLYAHLLGKIATDHIDERAPDRLRELARVSRLLELDAALTAGHLEDCGLGRATRYVLPLVAAQEDDAFARAVLRWLPANRSDDLVAACVRRLVRNTPALSAIGAVASHALGASWAESAVSLRLTLEDRLRHRVRCARVARSSQPGEQQP
jgi:hypothetical protein